MSEAPEREEPSLDLADAIREGLDVVASHEEFLPSLFAVVEEYLKEEIDFSHVGERVDVKESLMTALFAMAKRLLAYHPAPLGEA